MCQKYIKCIENVYFLIWKKMSQLLERPFTVRLLKIIVNHTHSVNDFNPMVIIKLYFI